MSRRRHLTVEYGSTFGGVSEISPEIIDAAAEWKAHPLRGRRTRISTLGIEVAINAAWPALFLPASTLDAIAEACVRIEVSSVGVWDDGSDGLDAQSVTCDVRLGGSDAEVPFERIACDWDDETFAELVRRPESAGIPEKRDTVSFRIKGSSGAGTVPRQLGDGALESAIARLVDVASSETSGTLWDLAVYPSYDEADIRLSHDTLAAMADKGIGLAIEPIPGARERELIAASLR